MGKVIFETDCINLQQAMNSSNYSMSTIGNLISDMQFRLRMDFIEARVVYVPRNCNKPAHELAAWGVGRVHGDQTVWTTNFPTVVTRLVTSALTVS